MKTTKLVRPVLVESKETKSQNLLLYTIGKCIKRLSDVKIGELRLIQRMLFSFEYFQPQELILISLEDEKIEVGDTVYNYLNNKIRTVDLEKQLDFYNQDKDIVKVIARQSQISPEYISKFIEQYNNGCVLDLEIKIEENIVITQREPLIQHQGNKPVVVPHVIKNKPKLTNNFVTIVEKEPVIYTEDEVMDFLGRFGHYIMTHPDLDMGEEFEEAIYWFNQNKKK